MELLAYSAKQKSKNILTYFEWIIIVEANVELTVYLLNHTVG